MGLLDNILNTTTGGDSLSPQITDSKNYKHWISVEDPRRCFICKDTHGKIWMIGERTDPEPPVHPRCRCLVVLMQSIKAGTATINGIDGADWFLKYVGELPEYYISEKDLEALG